MAAPYTDIRGKLEAAISTLLTTVASAQGYTLLTGQDDASKALPNITVQFLENQGDPFLPGIQSGNSQCRLVVTISTALSAGLAAHQGAKKAVFDVIVSTDLAADINAAAGASLDITVWKAIAGGEVAFTERHVFKDGIEINCYASPSLMT